MKIDSIQAQGIKINNTPAFSLKNSVNFADKDCILESPIRFFHTPIIEAKRIGAFATIGDHSMLRHINTIGRFSMIAQHVSTGIGVHSAEMLSPHPMFGRWDRDWHDNHHHLYDDKDWSDELQKQNKKKIAAKNARINIGNDCWVGFKSIIMRGVTLGDGCVVAAGSVVTKDVPPYAIVGGVPARIIKYRFSPETVEKLVSIKWWEYDLEILKNIEIWDIENSIDELLKRKESNNYQLAKYTQFKLDELKGGKL